MNTLIRCMGTSNKVSCNICSQLPSTADTINIITTSLSHITTDTRTQHWNRVYQSHLFSEVTSL